MAEYSAAWTAETVPPPSSDVLDAVRASLTHLPLRAILPRRQHIVTVEHSQTVADALDTFAHHVIVSAPVLVAPGLEDLEEEAAAGGAGAAAAGDYPSSALSRLHSAYFGYLDIAGILRALLEHLRRKHGGRIPTSMLTLMSELEEEGAVFGQRAVVSIMSGE